MISNLIESVVALGLATDTSAETLGLVHALLDGENRQEVLGRVVAYVEKTYAGGLGEDERFLARDILEQVQEVLRTDMEDAFYDLVDRAGDAGFLDVTQFFSRLDPLLEGTAGGDDYEQLRAFVVESFDSSAETYLFAGETGMFEAVCEMSAALCKAYDTTVGAAH